MQTSFSFADGSWNVRWPERISRHDLVCLSPPLDPLQGMMLGNGDLGAIAWCEPRKLVVVVNKCDLWDDSTLPEGGFNPDYYRNEDRYTTLRHGCRVELDLALPLMDTWYLEDFEARLDLARAAFTVRSRTPFGLFSAHLFVSRRDCVVALEYDVETDEPVSPRLTVERWGSRTFAHWKCGGVSTDSSIGLSGTSASVAGEALLISQRLTNLRFVAAATLSENGQAVAPVREHRRGGAFTMAPAAHHAGCFFLTVANSEEHADPETEARNVVRTATSKGMPALTRDHEADWRSFWEAGAFLQTGLAFQDNLWHLALYYAGSSQRGRYPALFTQGLWGWNRDFQPWNFYYHWNQQQLTWMLPSAGHPELMKPYLGFRLDMLPAAERMAAREGKPGARFCDLADRQGNQPFYDLNRTPGGQLADDFMRYYRYTGDSAFLRERAWPFLLQAARYCLGMLEEGADGRLHTSPATAYEGSNIMRDCTTELVTVRKTLTIALEAMQILGLAVPEAAAWKQALDRLAPLVTMESPVNPGATIFAAGIQKGREQKAGQGLLWDAGDPEDWAGAHPTCERDPKRWGPIFSDVETSPVFPAGLIGLKERGTPPYAIACASAQEMGKGWTRPLVYARLGLREDMRQTLADAAAMTSCKGVNADSPDFWKIQTMPEAARMPTDFHVKDYWKHPDWLAARETQRQLRMWDFRRFGLEGLYLSSAGLAEALLQSHDGVIRISPACPAGVSFAFTLFAEGGFAVAAEGIGEQVAWVYITSRLGGLCRLANPWEGGRVFLRRAQADAWRETQGEMIAFETDAATAWILAPAPFDPGEAHSVEVEATRRDAPHVSPDGKATLGIPRTF
ncbi:MAG: hypothetical protein PHR35_04735 [Kiritimatiellae bacterium]|nr:hypothetical protein [Kiritimatiellia bacterium]